MTPTNRPSPLFDPSSGFVAFDRACQLLGMARELGPPSRDVPSAILDLPLDPTLEALLTREDGTRWSAPGVFSLRVLPLGGDESLARLNRISRAHADECAQPCFPLRDILLFAQVGWQASYLGTLPAQAGADGHTVLWVDLHEEPSVLPLASSVDGAFRLFAIYLERASAEHGLAGLQELCFPLEVGDLVAADAALVAQVRSGRLASYTRGDASIDRWLTETFFGHP